MEGTETAVLAFVFSAKYHPPYGLSRKPELQYAAPEFRVPSMKMTVYHNPRCSKSRAAVQLLEDRGVALRIVEYLKEPPDAKTLKGLLAKLRLTPRDIIRKSEPVYRDLGLEDPDLSAGALIKAMTANPILIERPIVVAGARAVVGRPPERVLELL